MTLSDALIDIARSAVPIVLNEGRRVSTPDGEGTVADNGHPRWVLVILDGSDLRLAYGRSEVEPI